MVGAPTGRILDPSRWTGGVAGGGCLPGLRQPTARLAGAAAVGSGGRRLGGRIILPAPEWAAESNAATWQSRNRVDSGGYLLARIGGDGRPKRLLRDCNNHLSAVVTAHGNGISRWVVVTPLQCACACHRVKGKGTGWGRLRASACARVHASARARVRAFYLNLNVANLRFQA
jgi:hypothetical protein